MLLQAEPFPMLVNRLPKHSFIKIQGNSAFLQFLKLMAKIWKVRKSFVTNL